MQLSCFWQLWLTNAKYGMQPWAITSNLGRRSLNTCEPSFFCHQFSGQRLALVSPVDLLQSWQSCLHMPTTLQFSTVKCSFKVLVLMLTHFSVMFIFSFNEKWRNGRERVGHREKRRTQNALGRLGWWQFPNLPSFQKHLRRMALYLVSHLTLMSYIRDRCFISIP